MHFVAWPMTGQNFHKIIDQRILNKKESAFYHKYQPTLTVLYFTCMPFVA